MIFLLAALTAAEVPSDPPAVFAKVISGTITEADYPPAALRRGAEGMTKVRLNITSEGSATNCSIVQSSGHRDLDAMVCPLATRRMRLSPALDREGKPRPMNGIMPVRWMVSP